MVLLLFVGHWPKGVGPNFTTSLPLLPVFIVVPSLYLAMWKTFPASLQAVLMDNCFGNCHNLGVSVGGDEFRIFLLGYLGHLFIIFLINC